MVDTVTDMTPADNYVSEIENRHHLSITRAWERVWPWPFLCDWGCFRGFLESNLGLLLWQTFAIGPFLPHAWQFTKRKQQTFKWWFPPHLWHVQGEPSSTCTRCTAGTVLHRSWIFFEALSIACAISYALWSVKLLSWRRQRWILWLLIPQLVYLWSYPW